MLAYVRVMKKGRVVDIPIRQKTIVKVRDSSGKVINKRAIVMGLAPENNFTRAYGREAFICFIGKQHKPYGGPYVVRRGANDLYPVGRAKHVPKQCREALEQYEHNYPQLARKKRRR
jgi:hypothetical protein